MQVEQLANVDVCKLTQYFYFTPQLFVISTTTQAKNPEMYRNATYIWLKNNISFLTVTCPAGINPAQCQF